MLALMLFQLPWTVRRNGPALAHRAVVTCRRARRQMLRVRARSKGRVSTHSGSCRRAMFCWAAVYAVVGLLTGGLGLGAVAEGIRHPLLSVLLAFTVGAWSAAAVNETSSLSASAEAFPRFPTPLS